MTTEVTPVPKELNPSKLIASDNHLILIRIPSEEKKSVIIKTDTDKKGYLYGIVADQGDDVSSKIKANFLEGHKCIYDRTQARDFVHDGVDYTTIHKDAVLAYYRNN